MWGQMYLDLMNMISTTQSYQRIDMISRSDEKSAINTEGGCYTQVVFLEYHPLCSKQNYTLCRETLSNYEGKWQVISSSVGGVLSSMLFSWRWNFECKIYHLKYFDRFWKAVILVFQPTLYTSTSSSFLHKKCITKY